MKSTLIAKLVSSMRLSIFLASLFIVHNGIAQDKIVKKGGETLDVKILEVGTNEIKYQIFSEPDGPIFIMDKDRISEVTYQNGRIERYESPLNDSELYIGQKKRAVKMNFISPLMGYTQVAYEQNLKPGRSFEVSLGIIGLGKNQNISYWDNPDNFENQKGAFGTFGYKFIRIPDFTTNNQKYGHIMQGLYVRPEAMVGHFSRNYISSLNRVEKQKITFGALTVNLGKQWVFSDIFLIDIYGGVGYAFRGTSNTNSEYENNNSRLYGLIAADGDAAFAISGGFRIGILLN